jgi:signal transduction histidine kinase
MGERPGDVGRASRELENFVVTAAHDLVAPLRAIGGFSSALLEEYSDVLDETGRGYAERIHRASERMVLVINGLLHLSLLARSQLHLEPVDLGAEASDIAERLQSEDYGRSVQFVIQRPARAQADRSLIRTALENLLDNAWKFTSRQRHSLIEFGTETASGQDGVCYFVRDNGVGFDAAHADKLFTPLRRLATAREFPGAGVGLAGVEQIVARHGGRVWADGSIGKGATFYFTLTRRPPHDEPDDPHDRG